MLFEPPSFSLLFYSTLANLDAGTVGDHVYGTGLLPYAGLKWIQPFLPPEAMYFCSIYGNIELVELV